jgi:uncharacterized protein with PIN domain
MSNAESRKRAAVIRRRDIRTKAANLQAETPPRFAADVMLGRLAKWLRIAGFDVLYSNRFTDDELVSLSSSEGRILLSRDTRLLIRRAVRLFIFLESEDIVEQIRQIFRITGTTALNALLTRCLACNEVLSEIARHEARDRVPPFVFQTQEKFKVCPQCRKIYWAGTHRQSILRILEKLVCAPRIP